ETRMLARVEPHGEDRLPGVGDGYARAQEWVPGVPYSEVGGVGQGPGCGQPVPASLERVRGQLHGSGVDARGGKGPFPVDVHTLAVGLGQGGRDLRGYVSDST